MDVKLQDEVGRVSALHRYEVLDTPSEQPFDRITKLVQTVFSVPIVTVSLIDSNRQWFKSCVGVDSRETPRDISFCTHTIQTRDPLYIQDATRDHRFSKNPFVMGAPFIRSYLGVPLATPDGYNIGSLCAIDSKPREYTTEQIQMLKSFGALVVDELELRRIAQTDSLTGAVTRRGFLLEMEKMLARSNRSEMHGALVMLDIDHFKAVNDTFGHPMGDTVLRTVSKKLSDMLRSGDVFGRLGGEEFGILLPNTDVPGAYQTAERLRDAIASGPISTRPYLQVTASFGISGLQPELSSNDWLAGADKALYQAKHSGRNRCCLA
jgi:diguanylate cyclase (GGDEF)-like protein